MKNLKKYIIIIAVLTTTLLGFDTKKLKCDQVIEHTDYSVCYDYTLKSVIAGWTTLYGKKTLHSIKNRPWYHADRQLRKQFRHSKRIKKNSLLENGHTVIADDDTDYDWYILKEAYSLANITPMYKNFNRRVWNKVEIRGRYLSRVFKKVKSITIVEYDGNKTYKGWHIPSKYYRIYESKYHSECYEYKHHRYSYKEWKNDKLSKHKICCDKLYKD